MNRAHLFRFVFVSIFIALLQTPLAPNDARRVVRAAPGPPALAPAAPNILAAGGRTTRVSVASNGAQANDLSLSPAISANGRFVAFVSRARTLVANDTNSCDPWTIPGSCPDVFVHDNETGRTLRVSVASDGTQANAASHDPAISADGRYVTFWSAASNLVPGDADLCEDFYSGQPISCADVFVHDLLTRQTNLVSMASDGAQGNAPSGYSSISADGRYVIFSSTATNLAPNDTALCYTYEGTPNNCADVFLHDRHTGQTEIVSVDSNDVYGNDSSNPIGVAADGHLVFFNSDASNLVSGDGNGEIDAFVHDRRTGETTRLNMTPDGSESTGGGGIASVSADGRFVTFTAYDGDFVADDDNHAWDVFIHDRETGETSLVSVAPDGSQANGSSTSQAVSPDGQYVAFASDATNLIPGDTQPAGVVVRHMLTGEIWRVSVASDGTPGNSSLYEVAASNGARFVAFGTDATNLVSGDTNETFDIFVHDSRTLALNYETGAPGSYFRVDGTSYPANEQAAVQVNGQVLANVPTATDGKLQFVLDTAVAGEGAYFVGINGEPGLMLSFVLDGDQPLRPQEGEGQVIQVRSGIAFVENIFLPLTFVLPARAPLPVGDTTRVSADGRYVTFSSAASNLVAGDTNNTADVFVHDRQTSETTRVSVSSDGAQANRYSLDMLPLMPTPAT